MQWEATARPSSAVAGLYQSAVGGYHDAASAPRRLAAGISMLKVNAHRVIA